MISRRSILLGAAIAVSMTAEASAYEPGFPGWEQKPGITLGGGTAGAPPPGIYMFDQFLGYAAQLIGPSAPNVNGTPVQIRTESAAVGFIFVPNIPDFFGWRYNAVLVQPFITVSVSNPINLQALGVHNTYIVPVELSRKFGDSGFNVKVGFGMYVPSGDTSGPAGLSNVGNPWWTFQPEFVVSYLKDGWNFTANIFEEINTRSTVTNYKSGNILHAEFTAAKTIDRWTLGAVGYYVGQVTSDDSSDFYKGLINTRSYDIWAVGGRLGYDFGPVAANIWALRDVSARVSGFTPALGTLPMGSTVFASFSYRLWGPDAPGPTKIPLIHK